MKQIIDQPVKLLTFAGFMLLNLVSFEYAHAAGPAGRVEFIQGNAYIIDANNKLKPLKQNDPVQVGDTIVTSEDGEVQARMADEALVAVRENSQLKISSYRAEGDEDDSAVLDLLKGAFRNVTGWIGKYNRPKYKVNTPTATIGVRGTDFDVRLVEKNPAAQKLFGDPGVYHRVIDGGTTFKNKFGESRVDKNQAAFIPFKAKKAPKKLKEVPAFFLKKRPNDKKFEKKVKKQKKRLDTKLERRQKNLLKKGKIPKNKKLLKLPQGLKAKKRPGAASPVPLPYPNTPKAAPKKKLNDLPVKQRSGLKSQKLVPSKSLKSIKKPILPGLPAANTKKIPIIKKPALTKPGVKPSGHSGVKLTGKETMLKNKSVLMKEKQTVDKLKQEPKPALVQPAKPLPIQPQLLKSLPTKVKE